MDLEKYRKMYFSEHVATYRDLGDIKILDFKRPKYSRMYSIRYIFDENHQMSISGDYGSAVFRLTWDGSYIQSFSDVNLGYFFEKCDASSEGRSEFDEKCAVECLEYNKKPYVEEMNSAMKELEEIWQDEIKELKDDISGFKEDMLFDDEFDKKELKKMQDKLTDLQHKDNLSQMFDEDSEVIEARKKIEAYDFFISNVSGRDSSEEWAMFVNNNEEEADNLDNDYWDWLYQIGDIIPRRVNLWLAGLKLAHEQLGDIK